MLLQVALFFFVAEYYSICVYMCLNTHTYTHTLIHSSADWHLGCFHVLAIVNSALTNIGMHVSFQIKSSKYMSKSGTAGSYDNSIFSFLRVLHTGCTN